MPTIVLKDFNLGGISNSPYQGQADTLAEINGIDLHSEGGIIKAYQDFAKITFDQSANAGGFIKQLSNGNVYLFCRAKIYKYNAGLKTFFLTRALDNINPTFVEEFNGYTYFTDDDKSVWRVPTEDIETVGITEFMVNTLDEHDSDYGRSMFVKNGVLFITNNNKIASIDVDDNINVNAFDIESNFNITTLNEFGDDLAIPATNGIYSKIYRWDTYEKSWNPNVAIVPERKIGTVVKDYNGTLLCFTEGIGNVYYYNGINADWLKSIPGDFSKNGKIKIKQGAAERYNRDILFGISQGTETSADILKGVYNFGRTGPEYSRVLSFLFEQTDGVVYDITDTTEGLFVIIDNDAYIIDPEKKLETTHYVTRVIDVNRNELKDFSFYVNYKNFPDVCNIQVFEKRNGALTWTALNVTQNKTQSRFEADIKLLNTNTIRFKVVHISNGNDTPEVESLMIEY